MKTLRVGVIGLGFIGRAHVDALRRLPSLQVTAVAGSSAERTRVEAEALDIPNAYGDWRELISDAGVDVVHNCTPNNLHFAINRTALEAGKPCFSEKPLTVHSADAAELVDLAQARGVPVAVNFNHRGFPQMQHARALVAAGQVGDVHAVRGSYLQDWLLYDTDWSWRLDPSAGGVSRAVADIGAHWMDLAQHVSGARIVEVMADLSTVLPVRYKPHGTVQTFVRTNAPNPTETATEPLAQLATGVEAEGRATPNGTPVQVRSEDFASVLLRFDTGARGAFIVSQMSAGRKNRLVLALDGGRGALEWNSEDSERLWLGSRDGPSQLAQRDPGASLVPGISSLPAGHAEGWSDAVRTTIAGFYEMVRGGGRAPWVSSWEDGLREVALTEAILASSHAQRWVAPALVEVGRQTLRA